MNYQNSLPDEQLIQFYLQGDPNAMATLVELYKDRVYRFIFNIVHDRNVAEEIFQQTFITLINSMIAGKAGEAGNFLQWATRTAQQLCIAYNQTDPSLLCRPDEKVDLLQQPVFHAIHYHENHSKIKSMIDMLPGKQREVMLMNHYGGMSFNEIAASMKCSVSLALDYMKLALNNLCKMMTEKEMVLN